MLEEDKFSFGCMDNENHVIHASKRKLPGRNEVEGLKESK